MAPHAMPCVTSPRRGRGSCVSHLGTPILPLLVVSLWFVFFREHNLLVLQRVLSLSPRRLFHNTSSQSSPARLRATAAAAGSHRRDLRGVGFLRKAKTTMGGRRDFTTEYDESRSITPIDIPFLQPPDGFGLPGNGISLESLGEPKSGTTWLGRLVPELALELCGSYNNRWCEMGGLAVVPNDPAPYYDFELLNRTTPGLTQEAEGGGGPSLFLHYKGLHKHIIPGMNKWQMFGEDTREVPGECHNGGYPHKNGFEDHPPCLSREPPTRERLQDCLWDTSKACVQFTASVDPAVRRSFVIFRDPRDVVLSAYRYRTQVQRKTWVMELSREEYIRSEFEVLVSWIHQRWMWHTSTDFAPSSHVVYYEECQKKSEALVGIAAFMGLQCSQEQALRVWNSHQHPLPRGNFSTYGLSPEIIEWMTAVMARLLPPPLAARWGVAPTDLPLE